MSFKNLNKLQRVDLCLVPAAVLSIVTGFLLHGAGHAGNHAVWEAWAVAHSVVSIAFLTLIIVHLKQHKAWIKSFASKMRVKTPQGRMAIALGAFAAVTTLTGLVLLGIIDDHSPLGLWHYKIGIVFAVLAIAHVVRRHKALKVK